jgi:small-conductance mechanosensitive channel
MHLPSLLLLQALAPGERTPSLMERTLASLRELAAEAMGTGDFWGRVVVTLLLLLGLWVVRRLILRVVESRVDDPRARYQWGKVTSYVASILGFMVVGVIWLAGLRSIGTFLGLLSAGLAIALKDVVADLAAWLFIVFRRPFEVGDRVQIGPHAGDVVDLTVFQFTLLEIGNWVEADQSTGRVIHIPNALVFTQPLANYTQEFEYVWHEIAVPVSFESDWRRAREVLQQIARDHAAAHGREAEAQLRRATRKFFIRYAHLTPAIYTEIRPNGVLLTLRYLCPARARRTTAAQIQEALLEQFSREPRIQYAYPTSRIFRNNEEGKEALREGTMRPGHAPGEMGGSGSDLASGADGR